MISFSYRTESRFFTRHHCYSALQLCLVCLSAGPSYSLEVPSPGLVGHSTLPVDLSIFRKKRLISFTNLSRRLHDPGGLPVLCCTSLSDCFSGFVSFTDHASRGWLHFSLIFIATWRRNTAFRRAYGLLYPGTSMMISALPRYQDQEGSFQGPNVQQDLDRVTNPGSERRSLSQASRTFLSFWEEWCQRPQPYTALPLPLQLQVEAFADARADGELIGISGFISLPSGRCIWFSPAWQLSELSCPGLQLRRPAHKDIACYETLAQIALVHAYRTIFPSGRVAVRLPSFSDNASTEAVGAKLYTSKWPLGAFAQKLSIISALSGIELDISHVAGEKNDDADFLSRWNQVDTLPDRWKDDSRVDCSLQFIWFFSQRSSYLASAFFFTVAASGKARF